MDMYRSYGADRMAKFIINQYTTANSSGPSVEEKPIAPSLEGAMKAGGKFKNAIQVAKKCNCILAYNASANETILVSAIGDNEVFEPVPPLSGRYLKCTGEVYVAIKVIGVK